MAGLLNQGMAPQAPVQQSAAPSSQPQPGAQGQQRDPATDMDPEQAQAMYDALMEGMLGYLYDVGLPDVRQALSSDGDPVQAMAKVISTIMISTYHTLAQQGKTVPPGVMFQAGMELSKAVGEIAVRQQVLPAKDNGEPIEAAFMVALARFGQLVGETALSEGQRQRYAEMIRTMRELKQKHGQPQRAGMPSSDQSSAMQGDM